jgi:hypothetical protein
MKKLLFPILIAAISLMVMLPLTTVTHSSGKSKPAPRAETNAPAPNDAGKKDSVGNSREAMAVNGNAAEGEDTDVNDEGEDPDIPSFLQGKVDKAELLRLRGDQIAMIRGMMPDADFDPTARGRAIEMMEQQQEAAAELQADLFSKSVHSAFSLQLLAPFSFPTWNELGPNPIPLAQTSGGRSNASGRVSAIEIDPADPNKVYVGTAQGGVFRSLDGGATWTPIFDNAQSLAIGSLTLDAARDWLWVGTGEANGSADSFAGVGLYRVENASTSATLVGPINPIRNYTNGSGNPVSAGFFSGRSISKIVRVPGDPNTLFCGIAGGVIGLGGNPPLGNAVPPLGMRGMVRLSNVLGPPAGITGTRIAVSTTDIGQGLCAFDIPCTVNRNVNDLVLDPQDPSGNTLIVWLNGINVAGDGGIYRSTNAMSASPTFTQTMVTTSTSTSNGRGELRAYARGGTTVVYAASGEPVGGGTLCTATSQSGALRRSIDGGVTWSTKLPGGGGFCGGQCFYNIGFDVLPGAGTSTDKLLLGGNVSNVQNPGGIACARQEATSLNGAGTSFTAHDSITHADTHVIKFASSDPNVVYRGDDGGIWKSINGGDTFVPLNNTTFRATQFQSLALHPTDPDFTIGGTQDNGSERLTTGPVWIHSDDGDGGFTEIDQNAVNTTNVTMYHTFFNQAGTQIGYSRSITAGGSPAQWSFLGCSNSNTTRGISCTNTVNFYAPMAIGPGTPSTLYLGTDRLYRSADTGNSNQIVSQAPLVSGVPISAIGIARNDDNYRIVGLNNGALFFTTTGSSTLTNLDPTGGASTIPDFYVGRLVFDPNDKNTVYISLNGFAGGTAPSQSHVWRVTNLNNTPVKTAINGSGANTLPDVPVNAFAVDTNDPSHAGVSVLYAGTDIGVYQSVDGGANWVPFGIGLPRVAVFDMGIPNGKRVLRIATHGRGMWEIEIPDCMIATPANITTGNDLGQCGANVSYPDPSFTGSCGTITCLPASGSFFALGTTTVTCTSQASTSTSFTVTVNDTEPPTVTPISVANPTLGSNHDMIDVGLSGGSFSDNCGSATREVLVFGNEDDEGNAGDGNFSPDAGNIDIGTLRLRAERSGGGQGRVYLIVVKVTDAAGNVSVTVATVVVPKSNSKSAGDAVNAQAAAARAYALSHAGAPPPGYFVIGDGPIIGPKQ